MRPVLALFFCCVAFAADWKAGTARVDITPDGPIWMSGYASRKQPSQGVLHKLHARALALEDRRGGRIVIVTTDLIGLPRNITDVAGARLQKDHRLARERVLFNSSHTHTGPVVRPNLAVMYDLSPENERAVNEYSLRLTDNLVAVVSAALGDLKPASLSFGTGRAGFAMNRRERTPTGTIRLGVNPSGPMDHSVPVLRVTDQKGNARAVLFGYACHNTTLTGEHYSISGDFAGVAEAGLETSEPGVVAMFMQLCAGDQNPNPRGQEEYVARHGEALAAEVRRVLSGNMSAVKGETGAALQWRDLPLQPHTRDDFVKMLESREPVRVRFAREMIARYDERRPMRHATLPVQAIRLAKDLAIVALGGEPVVEYAAQIKAAHPKLRLIVAGYSNDVMGYIPTARMLEEGGYEPVASTLYYGIAAPFAPEVESLVLETANTVLKRAMQ
jgi:hypothetical protein